MDPMAAITIAASSLKYGFGFGHSLVNMVANTIPKISHYRKYDLSSVYSLAGLRGLPIPFKKEDTRFKRLERIRSKMKDEFDIEPVLEEFNIEELYPKIIKDGETNSY